jgi:hypothetical protein
MDFFTDYLVIKAIVLVAAAFVWGLWRGLTGRPMQVGQSDTTGPQAPLARR